MILEQLYLGCLSQASYLDSAERHGVRIELVVLTHVYAQHGAGCAAG
ncbi:MAG: hypothetical protein ACREOA_09555 [Candidatus Dormibacteria bacterium]